MALRRFVYSEKHIIGRNEHILGVKPRYMYSINIQRNSMSYHVKVAITDSTVFHLKML